MLAFIDEAGTRSRSAASSDHFVMAAVVFEVSNEPRATRLLADLRRDLGRGPGDPLSWKNLKSHALRIYAAQALGSQADWLRTSAVVVCKRFLAAGGIRTDDNAYLFTLRFLVERLSWMAREAPGGSRVLEHTLAHITRFKMSTLRGYEASLRRQPTQIDWSWLSPSGGKIDQPNRVVHLQLADLAASAIYRAFEPETDPRYLQALAPTLYRRGTSPLTSYGLKIHPWNNLTKAAYPWVGRV